MGMLCSSGGRTITLEPEDAFESLQGLLPVGPKFSVSCHFSGFNFHQLNRDNDAHVLRCLGEWRKIRGKTQNSNWHRAGPQLRRNSPLLMKPLCCLISFKDNLSILFFLILPVLLTRVERWRVGNSKRKNHLIGTENRMSLYRNGLKPLPKPGGQQPAASAGVPAAFLPISCSPG